ncbi:hypothetical protein H4R33_001382 [Dimargaris cristalligena]|nr:hypothetical protein H4R33_001382 [Dimargaris cristalligena]
MSERVSPAKTARDPHNDHRSQDSTSAILSQRSRGPGSHSMPRRRPTTTYAHPSGYLGNTRSHINQGGSHGSENGRPPAKDARLIGAAGLSHMASPLAIGDRRPADRSISIDQRIPPSISTRVSSVYGFPSNMAHVSDLISPVYEQRKSSLMSFYPHRSPAVLPVPDYEPSPSPSPPTPGLGLTASSTNIMKEGYLNRKTDLNPLNPVSTALLARGWKVYRVMLKGSKLYFYKPPSEGELRKKFPFEGSPLSTASPRLPAPDMESFDGDDSAAAFQGLPLLEAEFDISAVPFIFESDVQGGTIVPPLSTRYMFGGLFTEVDLAKFKFKRYVCLLIFDDVVVVCKRKWVKQHKGVVGAVSNAFRLARSISTRGKDTDNCSMRSIDAQGRSPGYFTKWKQHAAYPLTIVDVVEAASTRLAVPTSSFNPSSHGRSTIYSQTNISSTSVMTTSSTMSTDFSSVAGSGNVQAFQMFVSKGKESSTRLFVANSANDKAVWVARFMASKAAFGRRLRQQHVRPASSQRSTVSSTYGSMVRPAASIDSRPSHSTGRNQRRRLYWSTERHPELVIFTPEEVSKSSKDYVIRAGTKTALVHELLFFTPDSAAHAGVDFDTYLMAFLCTYPCFMTPAEFVKELERYAELISSTEESGTQFMHNFSQLLARWCKWAISDISSDLADTLIKLSAKLIMPINMTLATQIKEDISLALKPPPEVKRAAKVEETPVAPPASKGAPKSQQVRFVDCPEPSSPASPRSPTSPSRLRSPRLLHKRSQGGMAAAINSAPAEPTLESQLNGDGLHPTLFLRLNPEVVAQQLYLYHWSLYYQYDPLAIRSFLTPELTRVAGALASVTDGGSVLDSIPASDHNANDPSLHSRALHFTILNPHFIVRLIHCHLLTDLPLTRHSKRSALIGHWIKVGEAARRMNDAVTWAAVAVALTSPALIRLFEAWKEVPLPLLQTVRDQWAPLLLEHDLVYSATLLSSPRPQLLVLRPPITLEPRGSASSKQFNPATLPPIPYCGTICQALEHIEHVEPTTLTIEEVRRLTTVRDQDAQFVNLRKFWTMYEIMWRAIRDSPVQQPVYTPPSTGLSRSSSRASINPRNSGGSSISLSSMKPALVVGALAQSIGGKSPTTAPANPALACLHAQLPPGVDISSVQPHLAYQNYFKSLDQYRGDNAHNSLVNEYDPKHLFHLSLLCEPSASEQYLAHHGQEIANLESVVSPLACPEVIVSTRLTHFLAIQGRLDMIPFRPSGDGMARPRLSSVNSNSMFHYGTSNSNGMAMSRESSVGSAAAAAAAAAIRPLTGFGLSSIISTVESSFGLLGNSGAGSAGGANHSSCGVGSNSSPLTSSPRVGPISVSNAHSDGAGNGRSDRRSPTQGPRMVKNRSNTSADGKIAISGPLPASLIKLSPQKENYPASETQSPSLRPSASVPRLKNKRSMSFPSSSGNTGSSELGTSAESTTDSVIRPDSPSPAPRSQSTPMGRSVSKSSFQAADLPAGVILTITSSDLLLKIQHFKNKTVRKRDGTTSCREELMVSVHGGSVERLVDVLIHGVRQYQNQLSTLSNRDATIALRGELQLDYPQYQASFFATYRSLANGLEVLNLLRMYYDGAPVYAKRLVALARECGDGGSSNPTSTNAITRATTLSRNEEVVVGDVKRRVLSLCDYWIRYFQADFLDSLSIRDAMIDFLQAVAQDTQLPGPLETTSPTSIRNRLLRSCLIPALVLSPLQTPTTPGKSSAPALCGTRFDTVAPSKMPSIDLQRFDPLALLNGLNFEATLLFSRTRPQDWLLTFSLLEAQTIDGLAWYPSRRTLVLSDEETVVGDILTVLETIKRVRPALDIAPDITPTAVGTVQTGESFLTKILPSAIQHLLFFHRNLRQWVISNLSDPNIDLETRVQYLLTWLEVLRICRTDPYRIAVHFVRDSLNANLSSNIAIPARALGPAVDRLHVPSFVEAAIASALVSPESRAFSKAWSEVAHLTNMATDTLEALLRYDGSFLEALHGSGQSGGGFSSTPSPTEARPSMADLSTARGLAAGNARLVPGLGWLLQNMIELCYDVTDHIVDNEQLVYFEKRRRIQALISICDKLCQEPRGQLPPATPNFPFLTVYGDLPALPFRRAAEVAANENTHIHTYHSNSHGGPMNLKLVRPFHRLVVDEQERCRREGKVREKLEREIRELSLSQKRREQERDRQLKKQLKEHQHRRAKSEQLLKMSSLMRSVAHPVPSGARAAAGIRRMPSVKAALVINLINSTTDVEHAYTKRDHVFRIITEEGGQYLMQASSKEDMLDWIRCVHEAAKEAAARRLTVFVQEAKRKEARQSRETANPGGSMGPEQESDEEIDDLVVSGQLGGGNGPARTAESRAFGVDLHSLMPHGRIPPFVERCLCEIESRGLEEVGIYRVPGSVAGINKLRDLFNEGHWDIDLAADEYYDINVVAGVLKLFLRDLPEPLLTFQLYEGFINAAAVDDYNERLWAIKDLIHALPKSSYTLLKRIIEHLERVTDFEEVNHMYSTNLAIVFGPTLLKPLPGPHSFGTSMTNLGHHQNIVKNLILQYHWIFDVEDEAEAIPDAEVNKSQQDSIEEEGEGEADSSMSMDPPLSATTQTTLPDKSSTESLLSPTEPLDQAAVQSEPSTTASLKAPSIDSALPPSDGLGDLMDAVSNWKVKS